MKTSSLSFTHTHTFLQVVVVLTLVAVSAVPCKAQSIAQPPQITWGRYFDDACPGSHFDKEDLGERIFYFENSVYIIGRSKSDSLYPTIAGNTSPNPYGDAFIASYNPECHTYNWIRYFGGPTSEEYAYCAAVDKDGDNSYVYIAGEVNELGGDKPDMLKAEWYDASGCSQVFKKKSTDKKEAFIAKYNAATGELLRWTYFGGKGADQILSMEVDTVTHVLYFDGYTESPSIIESSTLDFTPYKNDFTGKGKMFFGAIDPCLNYLKYFSYYGGNGWDRAHSLKILYANNTRYLVMSGTTQSTSGIVPSNVACFDSTYGGGKKDDKNPDAFILIWNVNTLSSPPDWATYWGGSDIDRGREVSLTSNNEIYLTGQTLSNPDTGANATFVPTADAYMPDRGMRYDGYAVKFKINSFNAPMNVQLAMFTYVGGNKDDYPQSIISFHSTDASNGTDTFVVAGLTHSPDFPSSDSSAYFLSKEINGNGKTSNRDAFIAVFTKDPAHPGMNQKLSSFTYLGGQNDETDIEIKGILVQKSYNPGIALGPNGAVYIVYSTRGTKTKINGNIPVEFGAFHPAVDSGAKTVPDAYFAEVYPFIQHFTPSDCMIAEDEKENANTVSAGDVSCFPVPFSNAITFEIVANQLKEATISIYDLLGRMIIEKNVSLHAGNNNVPFDLSAYPSGMYISKAMIAGSIYEMKIVKED